MKKSLIVQHLKTKKHKENKEKCEEMFVSNEVLGCYPAKEEVGQDHLDQQPSRSANTFNRDLCTALISSNIPIFKVSNKSFSSFLEKYTGHKVPDETTLGKYYVEAMYGATIGSKK